ncbi:alpha-ketoglutarate-dependent dioxygenase alkB-like 4 isoform 1, partial [Silurus asotus]
CLMAAKQQTANCGCKGVRTCLICETDEDKRHLLKSKASVHYDFVYNQESELAVPVAGNIQEAFPFPGVFLLENFVSEDEERELVASMDQEIWRESQSGRRKQDFGPKVNFKKQRVRLGAFSGLPASSQKLLDRMSKEPLLADFHPVEQCNLEYSPERGSAIDPHLDDSWLWGERLVTLNLLSDTVITMSLDQGWEDMDQGEVRVAVKMPRRCLFVLFGDARHRWKHAIHREDVHSRRVCSTFRELTAEFLYGGEQEKLGSELLELASSFKGVPI